MCIAMTWLRRAMRFCWIERRCQIGRRLWSGARGRRWRSWRRIYLPGFFNTSAVQDLDSLASYTVNPQKKFSYHAARDCAGGASQLSGDEWGAGAGPGGCSDIRHQ